MPFSERAKRTALAIVKIFETAKPFGRYDALVVDHAGISFGISQFTHASGSLYEVLKRAKRLGAIFPVVVEEALGDFAAKRNVGGRGNQPALKAALMRLGSDARVQQAQREIAYEKYLAPALAACDGDDFACPLSLAVVYDSITHGSFAKIRDRVTVHRPGNGSIKPIEYEKEWITQYVRRRDHWLENHRIPLLRKTDYRTDFFLAQIARDNWDLDLPLNVHGIRLTEAVLFPDGDPDAVAFTDAEIDAAVDGINETESATAIHSDTPDTPVATFQEQSVVPPTQPLESPQSLPTPTEGQTAATEFVPETVTVEAPPPDGSTATATKTTLFGIAVPAGLYAAFEAAKQWVAEGVIDIKSIFDVLIGLIRDNARYIPYLIGFIVSILLVKKVFRQLTLLATMFINANPNMHNITVVPSSEPKRYWWQIWK